MSIFSEIIWHKLQRAALDGSIQCLAHASLQGVSSRLRQKIYSEPFQDISHVSMKYHIRLAHITCNTDCASALQGIAPPACIKSLYMLIRYVCMPAAAHRATPFEVFETYFVDSRLREYRV